MDFGRRRRSGAGNGSNEFPNVTQFDEVRTMPISAGNNEDRPLFGDTYGNGYAPQTNSQPAFGAQYPQQPTNAQPMFGGQYDSAPNEKPFDYMPPASAQAPFGGSFVPPAAGQPMFGGNVGAVGQSGYVVAPIPQNNERPMVFSDSRVKGQYIYEYSDRLEYYQVSGNKIVHTATRYKIKN